MDWQPMAPPTTLASPMSSYQPQQPSPHQLPTQYLPPQQPEPQRVHSPLVGHSPQLQQHQHAKSPALAHSKHIAHQAVTHSQHKSSAATVRADHATRVSASPRMATQPLTRSPSVSSTRSTPALVPHFHDTNALLLCVAEDLLARSRRGARDIAGALDEQRLSEYHKMVATALHCLEVAIGSNKLPARTEALARLRYASTLCLETDNVMEAETALTKGITLCERNRFVDLKYSMHLLQIKLLFSQHKNKAALIAVETRIKEVEVLKYVHWIYAFRFLKASFYLQFPSPIEAHALENLRAISTVASNRGDRAIYVFASLLEALSHLRAMKDDAYVRIQGCLAQASKYQFESSTRIPQLDVLTLILDLACSLQQKEPAMIAQKTKALQKRMDESVRDKSWPDLDRKFYLPMAKQRTGQQTISQDTSSILQPGQDADAFDYIVLSFWSKLEAFATQYTYNGLALLYVQPRDVTDAKGSMSLKLWAEAMIQLKTNPSKVRGTPFCLEDAIQNTSWEKETTCYLHILCALYHAASADWDEVKKSVNVLGTMSRSTVGNTTTLYYLYLQGVYHQGTGNIQAAIRAYSDPKLSLESISRRNQKRADTDVALLAAFNMIWIMQHPRYRSDQLTQDLLERIRPFCTECTNLEIRTAYNLVLGAIHTDPPMPMTSVKTHISTALSNAKSFGDVQTMSIALSLMRARLFQSIVGDQALKSAKAASQQARRSGNSLWMSVTDGMLSQTFEVQGQNADAQRTWNDAVGYANRVLPRSGGE
ncbi:cohesin loading factor-domain-containing protein [Xylariaceae sp. FL1019]|nr:cohesin loading factor-domain-containing protein [Xylariaceae sp. FL1019]